MENFRGIAKNYLDKLMGIKIPKVSGYKGVLYASFGTLFGLYFLHTVAKYNGLLCKKNVSGQHVFITGGGSGLGKQLAFRFAKLGCKVTLADISQEGIESVKQQLNDQGFNQIFAVQCDVSFPEAVKVAVEESVNTHGPVDILINNAGIVSGKKILENSETLMIKTVQVNAIAHFWTVRQVLPHMLQYNKGHIVSIASASGVTGVVGLADYSASKFAAVGFDESLRLELKKLNSNVQTTCICPFYIDTGMFKGVRSKFPLLLPILKESISQLYIKLLLDYVADRIMWAILQNESVVMIPFIINVSQVLRQILPTSCFDYSCKVLGISDSMDQFQGRH